MDRNDLYKRTAFRCPFPALSLLYNLYYLASRAFLSRNARFRDFRLRVNLFKRLVGAYPQSP